VGTPPQGKQKHSLPGSGLKIRDMKVCWWSAGATSAVAAKLAIEKYNDVELFYIGISSAHPDNERFIRDCENWYGQKINIVSNSKGYADQFEVIEHTGYVNGPAGARCTLELKKQVRRELQEKHNFSNHIMGYEYSPNEINRAIRFKEQHPDTNPIFPLIENKISGEEAHAIVTGAGIELPEMYKLGFQNNNCIGCVKGGKGYWNNIRVHFPNTFDRMARLEREIGRSCINEVFLDELNPQEGILNPIVPGCGMFCQVEFAHLMDSKVEKILSGQISINEA